MKIRPVRADLLHADERTGAQTDIDDQVRSFANGPNKTRTRISRGGDKRR
jgi:hypothetical protein